MSPIALTMEKSISSSIYLGLLVLDQRALASKILYINISEYVMEVLLNILHITLLKCNYRCLQKLFFNLFSYQSLNNSANEA